MPQMGILQISKKCAKVVKIFDMSKFSDGKRGLLCYETLLSAKKINLLRKNKTLSDSYRTFVGGLSDLCWPMAKMKLQPTTFSPSEKTMGFTRERTRERGESGGRDQGLPGRGYSPPPIITHLPRTYHPLMTH